MVLGVGDWRFFYREAVASLAQYWRVSAYAGERIWKDFYSEGVAFEGHENVPIVEGLVVSLGRFQILYRFGMPWGFEAQPRWGAIQL